MPGIIRSRLVAVKNRERQLNRNDFLSVPEPEPAVDLDALTYRDMQELAKSRGVAAGGSKVNLRSRLKES